jgi:hypothetical protein
MTSPLLTSTRLSSKTTRTNLQNLPRLHAVQYELMPDSQTLDTLFSDSMHALWVAGGSLPAAKRQVWMKQSRTTLTKMSRRSAAAWFSNFPLEEAWVSFNGADGNSMSVKFDTTRTFLDSKVENDLKYRLGVQEYFLDRAAFRLTFVFDAASARQTRARELLLRLNYLPVRLVPRLVG